MSIKPSRALRVSIFVYDEVLRRKGILIPLFFASSMAEIMVGMNISPVTRLILLAPLSSSSKKISVRRASSIYLPVSPLLMALFWQKTQPMLHPAKNTVPEPDIPEIQGSSHM